MRFRLAVFLVVVLALVSVASTEVRFKSLSVTQASQTYVFPVPAASVLICNYGAAISYHRLFTENDTTAAATTSFTPIPAGSATAPTCKSYDKTTSQSAYWKALSVVCDTGLTATVTLEMD